MQNELLEFLKSNETQHEFIIDKYGIKGVLIMIKYKYDENNIFLYTQYQYENSLDILKQFEYSGFYNLKSNTFYDIKAYNLENIVIPQDNIISLSKLKEIINSLVIKKCKEIINRDFKNIEVLKSKVKLSEYEKRKIEYYKKFAHKQEAQKYFLDEKTINDIEISINDVKNISVDDILKYIDNDKLLIDDIAIKHVNNNLNSIYIKILCSEMLKKEFLKIQNDKTNILHIKKAIKDCIKDQKTVNVTIFKDNKEFTFKTGVNELKRVAFLSYYLEYDMIAKDRKKFYELFGKNADYKAEEITKIMYSKKVLYSKEVAK